MSGTKAHVMRVTAAGEQRLAGAMAAQTCADAIAANREAVKVILVGVVKDAAGWGEIDNWAMAAIDQAIAGEPVDLATLEAAVAQWKATQAGA